MSTEMNLRSKLVIDAKETEKWRELTDKVSEINRLFKKSDENTDKIVELEDDIQKIVTKLNADMKESMVAKLIATDNQVLEYIKLRYRNVFGVGKKQPTEDKEGNIIPASIKITERIQILEFSDVPKWQEKAGDEHKKFSDLFAKENALIYLSCLNYTMYAERAKKYEITDGRIAKIINSEAAKVLEKEYGTEFKSKRAKAKILQAMLDNILFIKGKTDDENIFKVDKRLVAFFEDNYTRFSNKTINGVVFPKFKTFDTIFMRLAHLVVTGDKIQGE